MDGGTGSLAAPFVPLDVMLLACRDDANKLAAGDRPKSALCTSDTRRWRAPATASFRDSDGVAIFAV